MNTLANAITNDATTIRTENGDVTYSTSLDACVDLFFKIGGYRSRTEAEIKTLFNKAFSESPEIATRILLWARDPRGGAGERRVPRVIFTWLDERDQEIAQRVMARIPEVGRWDDLFQFEYGRDFVARLFAEAIEKEDGLAAKWAPREGSKNHIWGDRIRQSLGLDWKQYRRLVAKLSKTVEQAMCAKDWDGINYEHVPSVAQTKYTKAFTRHDGDRFRSYIEAVHKGDAKINAGALFPYNVIKTAGHNENHAEALWKNLPDYVPEGMSFIPLIDVSASMTWTQVSDGLYPMDVATSLGVYLSERNKSVFKDLVLPFTGSPRWERLKGGILDRVNQIRRMDVSSTDLDAAMKLIIDTAVKNNVPQEDMPDYLLVMSDMEFNAGWGARTVAQRTVDMFKEAGYAVPNIVWWNIQSRGDTTPVRFNENGMALVSGASPAVVKALLNGEVNPHSIMMNAISDEKYDF